MADKLIYELTDTQATYSPDIYLQVDDVSFTNTKKMPVDVVYPKTNTLGAAGDFNPATQLLRMDNGSGSESKVTVDDMLTDSDVIDTIQDNLVTTSLTDSDLYAPEGTLIGRLTLRKTGVFVVGICEVLSDQTGSLPPKSVYSDNGGVNLYSLTAALRPRDDVAFFTNIHNTEQNSVTFKTNGQMESFFDLGPLYNQNIGISYITA